MGRLNFSIAINLLTENFKKNTSFVKSQFASMRAQALSFAAALGATTLGLGSFVSQLIEVARETSRANTALKNVSGGTLNFANNLRFTTGLANKYGIYVNDLTSNYSKFTAAATSAGMALNDQKKIFESLSRASVAYGMSAEDSNLMFLAVTQMMSKGKISSEELRRQLGERLPIAMAAMAKAAGVPIQKLDKLLKDGKLLSGEVLPKFADALNNMIPDVNTDNIETSISRLKNAFQEFTTGTGISAGYKSLIDILTKAVKNATENIKYLVSDLAAFVMGVALGKMFRWIATEIAAAQKTAMYAAARASKAAGVAFDEVAWKAQSAGVTMSTAFAKAGAAIKSAFLSALPTAIFVAISFIIEKLITVSSETRRIKNLFAEYRKEVNAATHTTEIAQLQVLQKLYADSAGNAALQNRYKEKIISLLGTELKSNQDINSVISDRIKLLEATARVDINTRKKIEAQDQITSIMNKYGGSEGYSKATQSQAKFEAGRNPIDSFFNKFNDVNKDRETVNQLVKIVQKASQEISSDMKYVVVNEPAKEEPYNPDDDKKTKKTELQKSEEKYKESLNELNAQLELNKQSGGKLGLSQSEYNKSLDELNIKTLVDAKGTGDKEVLNSKYIKTLEDAVKHPLYNKAQGELEAVQKQYVEQLKTLKAQRENGGLTEKQYTQELKKLADETITTASSIQGISLAGKSFIAGLKVVSNTLTDLPTAKPRDATYDYKKTKPEITGEKLDIAKDYVDALKEQLQGQIGDMMIELDKAIQDKDFSKALKIAEAKVELKGLASAIKNMDGLDKALKLETVKEDIKELNKQLEDGMYSGIKDIASSSDRVVSAFSNLSDVFSDVDSSGWERIMAIWNAMTTTMDAFLSIIETINSITEVTKKLAKAKEAEAALDTETTATKIANMTAETTAQVTALGTRTAAQLAASAATSSAATIQMAAESTAAYAYIPFAGVALAEAQIAAMQALIAAAAVPKFSTGGIRPNTGDNLLTRVNPGEMILNDGQQSRLFQALSSGNFGAGKQVAASIVTKVRGKELILTINNELKSQGKKTIG